MAPIHHHFEKGCLSTIVIRFDHIILIEGLATLKLDKNEANNLKNYHLVLFRFDRAIRRSFFKRNNVKILKYGMTKNIYISRQKK